MNPTPTLPYRGRAPFGRDVLKFGSQHRFQFFLIGGEFADAFGQFFNRHRVAVVLPVKFGFGERRGLFGCTAFGFEFARQRW